MTQRSKHVPGTSILDIHAYKKKQRKKNPTAGKRWLGRAQIPGTNRVRTKAFEKVEDAWGWAEELVAKFRLGLDSGKRCTIRSAMPEYLEHMLGKGVRPDYVEQGRRILMAAADAGCNDLRDERLASKAEQFFRNLKARTRSESGRIKRTQVLDISNRTRNSYMNYLTGLARFCHKRRYLPYDPLAGIVERFKEDKKVKAVFTIEELRTIINDSHRNERFWLPFVLSVYGGFRVSEVMHLQWQDILWDQRRIMVRIKPQYALKNNKERFTILHEELSNILMPIAKPAGWIVDDHLRTHKTSWRYWFNQLLWRCKIDPGKRSPHSLRHTWAALSCACGMDPFQVMEYAGHSALETTLGYSRMANLYRETAQSWKRGSFSLVNSDSANAEVNIQKTI